MDNVIITDDLKLQFLPVNCEVKTRNITHETAKILFDTSSKDQVYFKFSDVETKFKSVIGSDYNSNNFPRKLMKGDLIIQCSYFRPKVESEKTSDDFIMFRLLTIN